MKLRQPIAIVVVSALIATACASDASSDAANPEPTVSTASTRSGEPVAIADPLRASVPLEEIVFDTFGSGPLTLAEATPEQILGLLDAIVPIDDPTYDTDGGWLDADDLVIGHVDKSGQARAWPHRILNFHEIVNDELDGQPALVSYCPLCRSGVIYSRLVDVDGTETVLSFGNSSALYENDLVMVDRQTGTYWWQVRGTGLVGALTDVELKPLASRTTTWSTWSANHPDTLILTRDSGGRSYGSDPFADYASAVDGGRFPFPVSGAALADQRLVPSALVIAVVDNNGNATAVATEVEEPIVVTVGTAGVQVWLDGQGGAVAFRHGLALRAVGEFVAGGPALTDSAGNRFDAAGRSLDGADDLVDEPSRSSFWFAIVASFPELTIVGCQQPVG